MYHVRFKSCASRIIVAAGRHDYVSGLDLSHAFESRLRSAYAVDTTDFTNYVCGFYGMIDYIFYDSSSLTCTRTTPLPTRRDVTELGALPNKKAASDHVALIGDFRW